MFLKLLTFCLLKISVNLFLKIPIMFNLILSISTNLSDFVLQSVGRFYWGIMPYSSLSSELMGISFAAIEQPEWPPVWGHVEPAMLVAPGISNPSTSWNSRNYQLPMFWLYPYIGNSKSLNFWDMEGFEVPTGEWSLFNIKPQCSHNWSHTL